MKSMYLIVIAVILSITNLISGDKDITLPKPQTGIGKPLMQCLSERQTSRGFSTKELSRQELSNLLWAACGINRSETGKRTAPSALNRQETDVYAAMQDGVYLYNAKQHSLILVLKEDIRALTGKQDFVKMAPLNLIYVADFAKMGDGSEEDKLVYGGADVGFIAENVYLYCSSQNLAVVVRGSIDKKALAAKLNLRPDQRIILAQTVGHPVEK